MFNNFGTGAGPERRGLPPVETLETLGTSEARLLWALRRLALMQPLGTARCHAVHVTLQREFGDAGLGLEHLLRCWLVGLARVSARRLVIGEPACPLLLADEVALLAVLRTAGADGGAADGGGAAEALVALTESPAAADLEALFAAVRVLAKIS